MTKQQLQIETDAAAKRTGAALQIVYDALNQGQRKKLLKDEAVAALLARYEVVL